MTVRENIKQLNSIVAMLEKCDPEMDSPCTFDMSMYSVQTAKQLAEITKAYLATNPGATAEKHPDESFYNVIVNDPEGNQIVYLYTRKGNVCKVVEEHEEEYEAEIPDPDFVVPTIKVKKTRTVKKWDCGESLLEAAHA